MKTHIYVLSCPLGLLKLGVAADPKQRLRNLQVGSPVPLELAAKYPMSDRPSAEAVAAALQERFWDRRERGHWFRATPLEVRRALTERSIIDLYRPSEAGERAAAREAAAAARAEARRVRKFGQRQICREILLARNHRGSGQPSSPEGCRARLHSTSQADANRAHIQLGSSHPIHRTNDAARESFTLNQSLSFFAREVRSAVPATVGCCGRRT